MSPKNNSQSIVVLGGGFLGKNITSYFKKNYHHVKLIDRKICDLLDLKKLSTLFQNIPPSSTFIITAAVTRLISNDRDSYDKNIKLIENLLKVIPIHAKHVIFFSTIDVYGLNPTLPISELNPVNPNDFYAKAKLDSEIILKKTSDDKGFNLTILRLCGVYGKDDALKSTINRLVSSAINERRINITSNPDIERDFISVNDIPRIIERIVSNNIIGVFNLATGQSHTLSNIAKKIVSILNFKVDINIRNKIEDDRVLKLQFDISSLSNELKEFKMTSLDDGLVDYINNYLSHEVKNNNED